ncbi:Peroxidase [Quillaja saponaria]|uniref:peroxidase n=1 Tax=Quillaja saponaria TaxID=32244 RepID=A0AAD7KUH1_QUISA|nr:Peroxidase [Quillaja saponaria]
MNRKLFSYFTISLCLIASFSPIVHMLPLGYNHLDYNFYYKSCPHLPMMVRFGVWSALRDDSRMAASLLRLHFHDCIVSACSMSVNTRYGYMCKTQLPPQS